MEIPIYLRARKSESNHANPKTQQHHIGMGDTQETVEISTEDT